ncbi:MAG TPA: L,D-transpeptidase family protein [Actinomycetota bacterium]|nr:L,D-transpeptidase family protein [Actinomycetota bacterium]
MAAGRHIRKRHLGASLAIVLAVAGCLLVVFGGVAYGAYRYEQGQADRILPGVTIAGVDVGGMTRDEARSAVEASVARTLSGSLTVIVGDHTWTKSQNSLGRTAAVEPAIDRALDVGTSMGTFDRFWHRVHARVAVAVPLHYRTPAASVRALVDQIAGTVMVKPTNASIGMEPDASNLTFIHAAAGRSIDQRSATIAIDRALRTGRTTVTVRTISVAPKVPDAKLGRTIVVHLDRNRLDLYQGFHVIHSWSVATAKPGFTTPDGIWTIYAKKVDPTWYNPALDGWGAGEPAVVGPGPGNPMGPRALYLTAPGLIRIHGTSDPASIGRYASHGCIRMNNDDVVALYPMVPVGTHVVVVGARPANASYWDTPPAQDT